MPTQQLFLFDAQDSARRAVQLALENLDPSRAAEALASFKSSWPEAPLDWEEPFLAALPDLVAEPMTVEPVVSRWTAFARLPLVEQLGPARMKRLQNRFFALLLERNALPSNRPRTAEGRSVGWLCWKAGLLEEAKKLLIREIQKYGNAPQARVWLANCHFESGDPHAARINYREALLGGVSEIDLEEIADRELAKFLISARRELGEWSPIEACIEGVLPPPKMTSRDQLDQFLNRFPAAPERPTLAFYRCLVISLNRHLTDAPTLLEARVQMRSLHPKLHALHMRLLERE